VLRRLSAGLGLFAVVINIDRVTVESHATELHRGTIHGMVARHDHSLLLLHHATLEARHTTTLLECTGRVAR
jgi:hypothetical protein